MDAPLAWPEGDPRLTTLRVASRYTRSDEVNVRVAARYLRVAYEFSNEKELRKYLREHPGADRSKHTVRKPSGRPAPEHDDTDHSQGDHGGHEAPRSWKDRLKGMSSAARKFVRAAPQEVKDFIQKPEARRTALQHAHDGLVNAPKKMVHRLVDTVKEEVHEFKEAGQGIKAVMSGGKMTKHQKAAFKTVAFHIGLTAAASVLTTGGALAAAGVFGKSMVKHLALKATSRALGHLHVLEELGHVGHGVAHVLDKMAADGKGRPKHEIAMVQLVLAALTKELEKLDNDDTIAKILEDAHADAA